jgi:hypothetical protein
LTTFSYPHGKGIYFLKKVFKISFDPLRGPKTT